MRISNLKELYFVTTYEHLTQECMRISNLKELYMMQSHEKDGFIKIIALQLGINTTIFELVIKCFVSE